MKERIAQWQPCRFITTENEGKTTAENERKITTKNEGKTLAENEGKTSGGNEGKTSTQNEGKTLGGNEINTAEPTIDQKQVIFLNTERCFCNDSSP